MNTSKLGFTVVTLGLAAILGYMAAKKFAPDTQTQSIHSYSVPSNRAEEIRNLLNRMFASDKNDGGVQVFGSGVIAVKGPEAYQQGIARLIEQITEQNPHTNHTIHIDYWLLRGEDAKESNLNAISPLEPVLQSISQSQGPKKFSVLEHLGFNSLELREVRIKGAMTEIKNWSKTVDGKIELRFETFTKRGLGELKVDTQLKPGEFVVLGENAMKPYADAIAEGKATPEQERKSWDVYHVVRAEILP